MHSADLQRKLFHYANCEPGNLSSGVAGRCLEEIRAMSSSASLRPDKLSALPGPFDQRLSARTYQEGHHRGDTLSG